MKLLKARFKNFAEFTNFECEFGDKITSLVGINGSGKSTVGLVGLQACLKGISEKTSKGELLGNRFLFIGPNGKSADIEYDFVDEKTGGKFTIKNHMTEAGNKITFKSESNVALDDEWLKDFLNVALMSAKHFTSLSGREQALLLGIDASSFDTELKGHKEEFTVLNRELKAFGDILPVEAVEPVDMAELKTKKEAIRKTLNAKYLENIELNKALRLNYDTAVEAYEKAEEFHASEQQARANKIESAISYEELLKQLGYQGLEVLQWIETLPFPETEYNGILPIVPDYIVEQPDDAALQAIDEQIMQASDTNTKAAAYKAYTERLAAKTAKEEAIAANKTNQEETIKARNAYINSFDFGFAGLSTDETGCLLLNGRPLCYPYYSKGQLEMIVARLHVSRNPQFKYRFLDDFELLDDANQEKLLTELFAEGFQVVIAEVRATGNRENILTLKNCAIDTGEEMKPSLI